LRFLLDFKEKYGDKWTEEDIKDFVNEQLAAG
jgi:hypothetical protein